MPQVIPTGYAHVIESLRLVGDPEDHAVTYGVLVNGPGAPTTQSLLDTLGLLFGTHVMATMPSQYSHVNTHLEWQQAAAPAAPVVGDRAASTVGGNALGPLIPQNSAHLVRKNTALGGRRNRGRLYLPGVGETTVGDNGVLTASRIAEVTGAMQAWRSALVTSADVDEMVILHSSSLLSPTPTPTPVTSLACQSVIATQRRRLR